VLLDSNIIIYAAQPNHSALRQWIEAHEPVVSVISYIEVLGFHRLSSPEQQLLEAFFAACEQLPVTDEVVRRATALRRERKMSLGDSIIAATALVHGMPLVTHNADDFRWIAELELLDPVA
jgi:predicted nucleic acid-binding protein